MVVQKFGGTSVADPDAIRRLIEIARAARTRDGRGPVVVVSAMSKVTDALLSDRRRRGRRHDRQRADARRAAARAPSRRWRARWHAGATSRRSRRTSTSSSTSSPPSSGRSPCCARCRRARSTSSPRWASCSARASSPRRSLNAGPAGRMGRRPPRHRHRRRAHAGASADARDHRGAARVGAAARRGRQGAGARRVRRRHGRGAYDDARARRVGLFGRARRRRHRRDGDSDLDRRGRHADRRSRASFRESRLVPQLSFAEAAELVVFRRQGAASEHDPPGGGARHPGADSQLVEAGGGRHADHRVAGAGRQRRSPRWRPSGT